MRDLPHFAELLRAALLAEGQTCAVGWGRDASISEDNQGPGTANRVVVYDGPADDEKGQWIRHTPNLKNTAKREQAGQFYRWQRVTVDIWGYCPAPDATTLDFGKEEAGQFRAKDYLTDAVERQIRHILGQQKHDSTFYDDLVNNRTSPLGRRHGDRAVFSFEICFTSRDPAPTISQFIESAPILTGVVATPSLTTTEETPP
jgi:hypothetical protein